MDSEKRNDSKMSDPSCSWDHSKNPLLTVVQLIGGFIFNIMRLPKTVKIIIGAVVSKASVPAIKRL